MSNRFTKDVAIMDDFLPINLFELFQVNISIEYNIISNDLFLVYFQSIRYRDSCQLAESLVIYSSCNICYWNDIYSSSLCFMFA